MTDNQQIQQDFRQMLLDRIESGNLDIETLLDRAVQRTSFLEMVEEMAQCEYGEYTGAPVVWEEPAQQEHLFRNPETGESAIWTMEDVMDAGTPIDAETGDDLEYVGPVGPPPEVKPRVVVVVRMSGGVVEEVGHNNPDVEITDVVFLETEHDVLTEDEEFCVMDQGQETDEFVYTHHVDIDRFNGAFVGEVLLAVERRAKFHQGNG